MKLKVINNNNLGHWITLLGGLLLATWLCLIPAVFSPLFAAATDYTDPVGYPGSWPTDLQWIPYTSNGTNVSDVAGGADGSTGGTTPSGAVDIVADYGPAVSWYSDGTNLYFRMQLSSSPLKLKEPSIPFVSATWNILLDTDGDGFKEFVVQIDGTGANQIMPDDIVVIYNDSATQAFTVTAPSDAIWRQDSADNPTDSAFQFIDGEPGKNAGKDYDTHGEVGLPIYDFTRSRLVDVDGTVTYLDFQIPLSSLDAASQGGPTFTTSTPFAMGFTTSNSNTDPVQVDLAYGGNFTAVATSPIPFGDFVDPNNNTYQSPIIQSFSASGCGPATLTTTILDSTTVVGGQVVSTATAEFQYYYDANADGVANDSGSGSDWFKAGDGVPTNNLAPWTLSWDSTGLPVGQYLLKVIARDDQGNVVDSSTLATPLILIHDNDACGSPIAVTILKSAQTTSDPLNGATSPYNIPGATVLYSLQITNLMLGTLDNDTVVVTDPIPANTELFVNDLGGAGSGPVLMIDGTAPVNSGLSYSFTSLASTTDDIEFSSDNGSTWTYTPVPDADGYDANVTNIRVNPKGVMRASDGTNHPTLMLRFSVRVQ